MGIFNLPAELFADIIDQLVLSIGIFKTLRLRTVAKRPNHAILRAVFDSHLINFDEPVYKRASRMSPPLVARLLLAQITHNPNQSRLLSAICKATQALKDHGQQTDNKTLTNALVICEAAAKYLYSVPGGSLGMLRQAYHGFTRAEDTQIALSAAIIVGDMSMVQSVLAKGADVKTENTYFGRPLQLAATCSHTEIVRSLLEYGADVHAVDGYLATSEEFEIASALSRPEDYYSSDGSALRAASLAGHYNIVRMLLKPQYGIPRSGPEYEKAVLAAARGGHADLLRLLMKRAIRHPGYASRLHHEIFWEASYHGRQAIVQMMLDDGLDVNAERDIIGIYVSALQLAAVHGHDKVIRLLLASGADRDFQKGDADTALNIAAGNGHEEAVQVLLDYGADITGIGSDKPPLTVAAQKGQVHMIHFLLRRGAVVSSPIGELALDSALHRGLSPVVRTLVEAGVPPNNSKQHLDPVLRAMIHGLDHVLETLLELGARKIDPLHSCYAAEFRSGEYPNPTEPVVSDIIITRETCRWVGKY